MITQTLSLLTQIIYITTPGVLFRLEGMNFVISRKQREKIRLSKNIILSN